MEKLIEEIERERRYNTYNIEVAFASFGEVIGLPEKANDTIYIVSLAVAKRVPEREDVFVPNESVRNEKGQIIGCKSLAHV